MISLYQIVHARTQTAIQVPYFPCKMCNYSRVAYSIFRYGTSPVSHNMFCYSSCRICLKIRNGGIQDSFVKNLAACNLNEYELLIASPIHQLKQKKASFSKISNIWNHFINMKLVSPLWKQLLLAIGPECAKCCLSYETVTYTCHPGISALRLWTAISVQPAQETQSCPLKNFYQNANGIASLTL